jgi:hypothetical protein
MTAALPPLQPAGALPGGSGWYGILVRGWIKWRPTRPWRETNYLLNAWGVSPAMDEVAGFKSACQAP